MSSATQCHSQERERNRDPCCSCFSQSENALQNWCQLVRCQHSVNVQAMQTNFYRWANKLNTALMKINLPCFCSSLHMTNAHWTRQVFGQCCGYYGHRANRCDLYFCAQSHNFKLQMMNTGFTSCVETSPALGKQEVTQFYWIFAATSLLQQLEQLQATYDYGL